MITRLFLLFSAIVLSLSTATEPTVDSSLPIDDEDFSTNAGFSLSFRASVNCNTNDWYQSNVDGLIDLLAHNVISRINQGCNQCGFNVNNFRNEIMSCQNHHITFNADIRDWDSREYPSNNILMIIESHFTNSSNPISLSTANITQLNGRVLLLNVTDVQITYLVMGSGGGSDDTTSSNPSTSDATMGGVSSTGTGSFSSTSNGNGASVQVIGDNSATMLRGVSVIVLTGSLLAMILQDTLNACTW